MGKPHESKLTDYLTEALAKSLTEEGRQSLLEERELVEAEAQREQLEALQIQTRPLDAPEVGEEAQTPHEVLPESRLDPILPAVVTVQEHPAREAGRLAFGGIVEGRELPPAQLPLLPAAEGPRVPLLELSDWRGIPTMARGRGAPLDLRLAVAACLLMPHASRASRGRLTVTVRELRDFLFPNGWERRRDWPRTRDALYRANNYVIPGPFLLGGRVVRDWLPFKLWGGASEDAGLEDLVVIEVQLPPGSAHGPVIDRRELARLGVHSAPRFRAYIAAHSVSWRPGRTRVVVPRSGGRRAWSADATSYPILTAKDRRRLAFGDDDKGHRTRAQQDAAWEDLPGVEILTRQAATPDGQGGWLIVPEEAAAAIRKGEPPREETE